MLLVTQTDVLGQLYGDKRAVEMIAEADFDAIDFSMFPMSRNDFVLNTADYKKYALEIKETADRAGTIFAQAHAPFSFSIQDGEEAYLKTVRERVIRSIEVASLLGAETLVVHPIQFRPYVTSKDFLMELNIKYYRELVPYCEKFGVKIACENMWQYNPKRGCIIDSVCSQPAEFCAYLDAIDSEFVVGCLDVGHCALTNIEPQDFIRAAGSNHIKAVHIHDNDYLHDCHTIPCLGKLDWDEITKAFADIGYEGEFTFESDVFLQSFGADIELSKAALTLMEKLGRKLVKKIRDYSK